MIRQMKRVKGIIRYFFSSTRWYKRHLQDPYVKKSQKQNYRSRAVYKLEEINLKYKLISNKNTFKILDLGAAPGSWSQYIRRLHPQTNIVAADILQIDPLEKVTFYRGDIQNQKLIDKIYKNHGQFDLIISDIAPSLTGQQDDHQEQIQLNRMCLAVAGKLLKVNGDLVMKTFIGPFQRQLVNSLQIIFEQVHRFKPKASRSQSSQQFLVSKRSKQKFRDSISKLSGVNYTGSLSKSDLRTLIS